MWLFFFFQAEDGIRDIGVTGVQTCALPICERQGIEELRPGYREGEDRGRDDARQGDRDEDLGEHLEPAGAVDERRLVELLRRSEERRVGKECRSRWSPYH